MRLSRLLVCTAIACLAGETRADEPLSNELAVLQRDLTSDDYRKVLGTMIPTDLEAEWERVATRDNYLLFAEQHGGETKVNADPALKQAYERRKQIADGFLAMMRSAYEKRGRKPPFDDRAKLDAALRSAATDAKAQAADAAIPVRVVMPAEGAERQWPRLRGPDGQGTAIDADLPMHWSDRDHVVWKVPIEGTGNSSPVIWGDRVYITTATKDGQQRQILCHSREDGRPLWQIAAPAPSATETLYTKNTYASSTLVADGERVIGFFGNSGLLCVDTNGKRQWHVDLGTFPTSHGPGASPLLYQDLLICIQYQNQGKTLFAAFDKRTGKKVWSHDRDKEMCWSTPVALRVGERDELVYNGSHQVVGYDPRTGLELWRVKGSSREAIPTIVVGGGLIYSCSGRNGPTLAIKPGGEGDVTATHIAWRNVRGGPHVTSPVFIKGRLYIVNDTGIASCLDAADGRTVWQSRLQGRFSTSPLEAGDKLLATSEEGKSYILQAGDKFKVLAENDLREPVLATPALLGGRLYIRSEKHLWCIGG